MSSPFSGKLGHASAGMTLDTYADFFDDDIDAFAVAPNNAKTAPGMIGE